MSHLRSFAKLSYLSPVFAGTAWAQHQSSSQPSDAEACAACGSCMGGVGIMALMPIIVVVVAIALNIALLVWVARDAKARGMDSSVLWMALVMFTGLIGLVIYLFSRPQGNLVPCQHCGNKRLQASAQCSNCGHD